MEFEYTICQIKSVDVFQIPPQATARGHRADEWKKSIWNGKLRITELNNFLFIKLLDVDNNLFAASKVDPKSPELSVERCLDSSRYFVIKVVNEATGQHAFLGIGFTERNEAFDFKAAIYDFKHRQEFEQKSEENKNVEYKEEDLSLKQGEKIHLEISGVKSRDKSKKGAGGLRKLAAPGSDKRQAHSVRSQIQANNMRQGQTGSTAAATGGLIGGGSSSATTSASTSSSGSSGFDDGFGDFLGAGNSNTATTTTTSAANNDPFGDFLGGSASTATTTTNTTAPTTGGNSGVSGNDLDAMFGSGSSGSTSNTTTNNPNNGNLLDF
eukprot:CAMPEP_0114989164 /NCGR_PEP_ID=MMETSP0216-20121206/10039_1 /TAXON_ID=223996 /ORGANISM="Protocruzia adherens, Strain Boccale" /LENGTH=324 /DNA_ID=CAMNT_0002352099 /DNA_START=39 /DNA_END=1013 /DNA_ORIENTATION=+